VKKEITCRYVKTASPFYAWEGGDRYSIEISGSINDETSL
jgi:hypothetical protein